MRLLDLMPRWPHYYALAALAASALTCTGCSLLFTKKAPDSIENVPVTAPVRCTSSVWAPVIDSLVGSFQVVRTGMAISNDESDYPANATLTREADIALGASLAAVFLSSAVYGYVVTDECRDFKAGKAGRQGERYELPPPRDDDHADVEADESAPTDESEPPVRRRKPRKPVSSRTPRAPSTAPPAPAADDP